MHPVLFSLIASGTLLVLLVALFNIEAKRGERFLSTSRRWLDERLLTVTRLMGHIQIHFGTGAFRYYIHFVIHRVLTSTLNFLKGIERFISQVQQHNKAVARSVQEEQESNHLRLIAEHKASNALSDEEKQELKDRSIGAV